MKVVDPVCHMTIEDKDAAAASTYKGTTYYFCAVPCKEAFDRDPEAFVGEKAEAPEAGPGPAEITDEMAKDPICGMVIKKDRSIKREAGGRTYYFCSEDCVRTFEAPEAELKSMKRRVTIALTGVVALAVLRAAAFLGLATGASIVTWAPAGSEVISRRPAETTAASPNSTY